jgi:hypothetical protein
MALMRSPWLDRGTAASENYVRRRRLVTVRAGGLAKLTMQLTARSRVQQAC